MHRYFVMKNPKTMRFTVFHHAKGQRPLIVAGGFTNVGDAFNWVSLSHEKPIFKQKGEGFR